MKFYVDGEQVDQKAFNETWENEKFGNSNFIVPPPSTPSVWRGKNLYVILPDWGKYNPERY